MLTFDRAARPRGRLLICPLLMQTIQQVVLWLGRPRSLCLFIGSKSEGMRLLCNLMVT